MRRLLLATIAFSAVAVAVSATPDARKPSATGSIEGTVVFEGTPPKRAKVNRGADPVCKKNKALDASVVVGKSGALRDVFVQIEAERAFPARAPSSAVVIDQVGCEYTPRVVGVVSGQELQIKNGDGTLHNVHAYLGGSTEWNLAQPKKAKPIAKTLNQTGILELKCDVHAWMRAWAVYVDHTQFDVTEADGAFVIENVPVGKHKLTAWHPTLGTKSVEVKVEKRKATPATITFD